MFFTQLFVRSVTNSFDGRREIAYANFSSPCCVKRSEMGIVMGKRKKNQPNNNDYIYMEALQHKKISLLTLDPTWHELFPEYRKTAEIKAYEQKLNDFIKKQGQTSNDIKDYENAKKVIMENIMNNMTDGQEAGGFLKQRKQEKNQKLMEQLKAKIAEAEAVRDNLPAEIDIANKQLLVASMRVCYEELSENTGKIEELDDWIIEAREELKQKVLEKQDMEMRNTTMYKCMHKMLGPQIVDIFDKGRNVWKGNVEENRGQKN